MRIVSLLPSATEIVASLGMVDCLVGRSHECDYPAGVERLPVLTAAKISLAGPSAAIDRDVKAVLRDALAVYRVDAEGLRALEPDVIVTQSQCDVCAVSLRDVEAAIRGWTDRAARLVSLHPYRLADVWRDLQDVAAALGVPDRGAHVAAELSARMAHLAQRCGGRARPKVAWLEWTDPPMACGTWIPEIVAMAGGDNLFGAAGEPAPWLDWEALVAADPDVLVVAPCGFDLARTRAEAATLAARPGWSSLKAVRGGKVMIVDGNQYFNRPGPRLADSLEIAGEMLHGDLDLGHRGRSWMPLGTAA